MLLGRDTLRC